MSIRGMPTAEMTGDILKVRDTKSFFLLKSDEILEVFFFIHSVHLFRNAFDVEVSKLD